MKNAGIVIIIVIVLVGIIWFATRSFGLRNDAALARQQEQAHPAQQQTQPAPQHK